MTTTTDHTLEALRDAGQDHEWYPTSARMINVVGDQLTATYGVDAIMDIGAGDGRVLKALAARCPDEPKLYAIEKSTVLIQAQPEDVVPVGTEFWEQNLACLPVDFIFSNPPYSQFEAWAEGIIEFGHARKAFLILPRRWQVSQIVQAALTRRGAAATAIGSDTFHDAERQSRAVVDIVAIEYPTRGRGFAGWRANVEDPFDTWFDRNIDTFDREEELDEPVCDRDELARRHAMSSIAEMVAAHDEEYARMEANYRAIFELDEALLRELGVGKSEVRDGIKKKIAGLKAKYWQLLFDRLDAITTRLTTNTKRRFLEKLTGQTSVAFTAANAYAVVLWAIKHANRYFDEQLVQLFRDLSTFDGAFNYKSNQKTWGRHEWRYHRMRDHTHYALDYRFIVSRHRAVFANDDGSGIGRYEYPGGLHDGCHALIDDIIAVMHNLGFTLGPQANSRERAWGSGWRQTFTTPGGETLFEVKAYMNGNLHMRFMPEAIKALNVEAGRLLGWLHGPQDVVDELGYTPDEAATYYGTSARIAPSQLKLLAPKSS